MRVHRIRWGRVALGGLFNELAMFAIVIPLRMVSETALYYSVPPLAVVTALFVGWWVASPLKSRQVLHGVLQAIIASGLYVGLTVGSGTAGEIPLLWHLSHGLRLIGGAAGGAIAARRAAAAAPASIV